MSSQIMHTQLSNRHSLAHVPGTPTVKRAQLLNIKTPVPGIWAGGCLLDNEIINYVCLNRRIGDLQLRARRRRRLQRLQSRNTETRMNSAGRWQG